jgi:hypothetical protein
VVEWVGKNSKFEIRNSKDLAREARILSGLKILRALARAIRESTLPNLTVLLEMKMAGPCRFAPF